MLGFLPGDAEEKFASLVVFVSNQRHLAVEFIDSDLIEMVDSYLAKEHSNYCNWIQEGF